MEVKEINNSLLALLQANKSTAQSSMSGVGMGFGDILASLDVADAAEGNKGAEFSRVKEQVSSRFNQDSAKDMSSYEKRDVVKESASDKNEATNIDKKDVNNKQQDKNKPAEQEQSKENVKEDATAGEKKTETSKDNKQQTGNDKVNAKPGEENISVSEEGEGAKVNAKEISLAALALMGSVVVVNPVDGTQIQVSGQDLANALSAQGLETVSLMEGKDNQAVIMMPEAENSEAAAFQNALQSFEKVADGTQIQSLKTQATTEAEVKENISQNIENNAVLDEQAAQLSEVTGNRKIKVEVNVKEEKIADKVDGGLVKENKLSDDVLSAIMTGDEAPSSLMETKAPATNMNQSSQALQSQTNQAKLAGAAVAQNTITSTTADEGATFSLDNNTATLAQAGSLGHENLPNAKVAANDAQNTSFRDVYKGMSKEVIDQVKVNITKSAVKGVDKVEIQLKPEDLGRIEIKMQIGKDGKLQAHIIASRPETAEILQKDMAGLQKAFNEAGFQTDEGSLSFSFRNEGQSNQEQERNNLRNFIGQALEQETVMDMAGNDTSYNGNWNGAGGLNIRV